MTEYIRVETTIIYVVGPLLIFLGTYFLMSIIVARSYIFASIKCKMTGRPMGIIINQVGSVRFPVLKYQGCSVEEKRKDKDARYGLTDKSRIDMPQGVKAFLLMDKLGLTLQPQVLHATTALERLGFSGMKMTETRYLKDLVDTATQGGYFADCTEEESEKKYLQLIDAGEKTLQEGGIYGDMFTMNFSTIYRWAKLEFNPTFNTVITERKLAKLRRELTGGLTAQILAGYVILAIILFIGTSIAYVIFKGGGGQIPALPIPL